MGFYLHLFKDEAVSLPEFVAIDEKKLTSNLSECSLATIYIYNNQSSLLHPWGNLVTVSFEVHPQCGRIAKELQYPECLQ